MSLLSYFHNMMRHADLIQMMTKKLNVQNALNEMPHGAEVMRRATARCMNCKNADACEHWLASTESAEHAPSYCNNADLFDRISKQQKAEGQLTTV